MHAYDVHKKIIKREIFGSLVRLIWLYKEMFKFKIISSLLTIKEV